MNLIVKCEIFCSAFVLNTNMRIPRLIFGDAYNAARPCYGKEQEIDLVNLLLIVWAFTNHTRTNYIIWAFHTISNRLVESTNPFRSKVNVPSIIIYSTITTPKLNPDESYQYNSRQLSLSLL